MIDLIFSKFQAFFSWRPSLLGVVSIAVIMLSAKCIDSVVDPDQWKNFAKKHPKLGFVGKMFKNLALSVAVLLILWVSIVFIIPAVFSGSSQIYWSMEADDPAALSNLPPDY